MYVVDMYRGAQRARRGFQHSLGGFNKGQSRLIEDCCTSLVLSDCLLGDAQPSFQASEDAHGVTANAGTSGRSEGVFTPSKSRSTTHVDPTVPGI